jgi:hypothetical protein
MTLISRPVVAAAIAVFGVLSAVLPGPAAAASQTVGEFDIVAGQTARLNVAMLDPAPSHCRVTLSFFGPGGQYVAVKGPVDLSAGSATSLDASGTGRLRAIVSVGAGACERAVQAVVEVF